MRRQLFVVVVMAVLASFLTACGTQDDEDGGVATLDAAAGDSSVDDAGDDSGEDSGEGADKDAEEAALEFAQCMRDNGVPDFPDPQVNEDGGMMLHREADADGRDRETERAAMEACRDKLPAVGGRFSEEDHAEMQERMLEYAACMREQGIDMPDPSFDGEGGPFRVELDPDDPAFQRAHQACGEELGGMMRRADGAGAGG